MLRVASRYINTRYSQSEHKNYKFKIYVRHITISGQDYVARHCRRWFGFYGGTEALIMYNAIGE